MPISFDLHLDSHKKTKTCFCSGRKNRIPRCRQKKMTRLVPHVGRCGSWEYKSARGVAVHIVLHPVLQRERRSNGADWLKDSQQVGQTDHHLSVDHLDPFCHEKTNTRNEYGILFLVVKKMRPKQRRDDANCWGGLKKRYTGNLRHCFRPVPPPEFQRGCDMNTVPNKRSSDRVYSAHFREPLCCRRGRGGGREEEESYLGG